MSPKILDKRNWQPSAWLLAILVSLLFLLIVAAVKALTAPLAVCIVAATGWPC